MAHGFEEYSLSWKEERDESASWFLQMGRLESNPHTSHILVGKNAKKTEVGTIPGHSPQRPASSDSALSGPTT